MKKVLIVFGTRPEAIKMAPIVRELKLYPELFDVKVCVTAQHRQMLDQVLAIFEIVPDFDLNIMAPNQDLFDITSKVLLGMRDVMNEFLPDLVLVHGDTTTSMATAIAAFYKQIKIAHVEAGLRTYDLSSPWPEEMNRQITDRICDYYFAPTQQSASNLLSEGIVKEKIFIIGNSVIDALLIAKEKIENSIDLQNTLQKEIERKGYCIAPDRKYILVTGHRRENFGEGFLNICRALKNIALNHSDLDIVYPVHLNPYVQKPVYEILSNISNIYLISPLDYLPFIYLMNHSFCLLTDSGGIQEEAPSLGKPVLVMRDTTERPEAVAAGTVKLVGTHTDCIIQNVEELLNDKTIYARMSASSNPYGKGTTSRQISQIINDEKL